MLRESQNFFYDLCSRPELIQKLRQDKKKVLKKYFRSPRDRDFLARYPAERFQIYRDHISFGILGNIASGFPVIRSLLSDREWNDLLNGFYLKRMSRSPIARQVLAEFARYLQAYKGPLTKKFPYLASLAEYENLELFVFFEEDVPESRRKHDGRAATSLFDKPILNPHLQMRTYTWPVHTISKGHHQVSRLKKGAYTLIVYRDPHSLDVRFIEANAFTEKLLRKIQRSKINVSALLKNLIREENIEKTQQEIFIQEAMATLGSLYEKNIIVGYAP